MFLNIGFYQSNGKNVKCQSWISRYLNWRQSVGEPEYFEGPPNGYSLFKEKPFKTSCLPNPHGIGMGLEWYKASFTVIGESLALNSNDVLRWRLFWESYTVYRLGKSSHWNNFSHQAIWLKESQKGRPTLPKSGKCDCQVCTGIYQGWGSFSRRL